MALDMTTALTIRARVDGQQQVDRLGQSLGTTTTKANGLAGAFGRLKAVGGSFIGVLGTAGLVAGLKKSIDTFGEFQAQTKLLENGLKNVGAGAGQLEKLQKVASDLGEATLFNEEDFRQGFGLLTSFGNIGVDSYERVAKAAADVAYTSGTEVSGAFMQLAKALNDPAKGLSALGRSGIQFTEDQKAVIESLQETGNIAEAQRLILVELEKQYGGNAAAAAQGLAGAFDTLGEKFYDLQVALGDNIAQVIEPLIVGLTKLVEVIVNLPEPVQTMIVALGGIVVAIGALGTVIAVGAPIVSALASLGPLIAGITATIAGWAGAIGPLIASLTGSGGLLAALAAVFTGPVGWIALAVAAGVAIYAFRDQIAAAFKVIGDVITAAAMLYYDVFIKPVITGAQVAVQGISAAFSGLANIMTAPFKQAMDSIKGIFRGILQYLANGINNSTRSINNLIAGYNRLPTPDIPLIPQVTVPAFAAGGVVNGPTLAMVGEGGEPEYIVPQSKMAKAAANYLSGMRGRSVIPAFADGGVVGPMGGGYDVFIKPVITGAELAVKGIRSAFSGLAQVMTAPFKQAMDSIKSIFRGILQFLANGINNLIAGYNRLPTPDIPLIPQVTVPAFAAGGVVNGPTLAMVGEGGQSEYIIPESKMAKASANYLNGMRGRSVIPAFADGGVVGPMGGGGAANTTVQITTGPVLQQDGQRYVTVSDLERALQDFGSQVFRNSRSYGGRRYQGAY